MNNFVGLPFNSFNGMGADHVRRIAKQSRDDTYGSNRDYQTLHERHGRRFAPHGIGPFHLVFEAELGSRADGLACWGAYLLARSSTTLRATFSIGAFKHVTKERIDQNWRRVGALVLDKPGAGNAKLTFEWDGGPIALDVWGLALGRPRVAEMISGEADPTLLQQSHLIPETFYLAHETAVDIEIAAEESGRFQLHDGAPIKLKKCSYCARLLPVDPARLGALAFHKHNAKLTKHQNECRACKKWRINDSFNPLRTTDQLHESSVITRERKLFLREPEILQEIKERTGRGLKSKVWDRFGRKCFRCHVPVAINEFQLDHTRPLAYLWPIDEFATCLCPKCNNEKKEKFPVDFYTPDQLRELSKIVDLPLSELQKKQINESELTRILDNIVLFAREWEPRTFLATARKIKELLPDVDLLRTLNDADPTESQRLDQELGSRPLPVGET